MSEEYIYAVARVRSRELTLFSRQDIDQLLSCKSAQECLRVLADKGWGSGDAALKPEALLAQETDKTWAFVQELTGDAEPFRILLTPVDYNNMKAAVKCVVTSTEPAQVFLGGGTIEPSVMLRCVRENDFTPLPAHMADAAESAYRTLLQTQDGQLCDIILDHACLSEVLEQGKKSDCDVLQQYAELLVAISDIKIAVRACRMKKTQNFLQEALVCCDTLDRDSLCTAACKDLDTVYAYLASTVYAEAAEHLRESYSAFEKWCDDKVMELMRTQKLNPFTIGPLFAYVVARQTEISTVRIILSGKRNELDDDAIRERMREMYV